MPDAAVVAAGPERGRGGPISGTGHPVMSQLKFFTPGSAGGENKVRDAVDQLLA